MGRPDLLGAGVRRPRCARVSLHFRLRGGQSDNPESVGVGPPSEGQIRPARPSYLGTRGSPRTVVRVRAGWVYAAPGTRTIRTTAVGVPGHREEVARPA